MDLPELGAGIIQKNCISGIFIYIFQMSTEKSWQNYLDRRCDASDSTPVEWVRTAVRDKVDDYILGWESSNIKTKRERERDRERRRVSTSWNFRTVSYLMWRPNRKNFQFSPFVSWNFEGDKIGRKRTWRYLHELDCRDELKLVAVFGIYRKSRFRTKDTSIFYSKTLIKVKNVLFPHWWRKFALSSEKMSLNAEKTRTNSKYWKSWTFRSLTQNAIWMGFYLKSILVLYGFRFKRSWKISNLVIRERLVPISRSIIIESSSRNFWTTRILMKRLM